MAEKQKPIGTHGNPKAQSIMPGINEYEQLVRDVLQAIVQGNLQPQDYQAIALGERAVQVARDFSGVLITGDNNTVTLVPPQEIELPSAEKINEDEVLREALAEYVKQLNKQASDDTPEKPYPGLTSYGLGDHEYFFGREAAIKTVLDQLRHTRLIWLHGNSGTGKTSLIRAGLLPRLLAEDGIPIVVRSFADSPTLALKKELLKHHWSESFEMVEDSLSQFIARLCKQYPSRSFYIFFDQFEEFFSKTDQELRNDFASELAECVTDPGLNVHLIFSLLSSYYGDTLMLRERISPRMYTESRLHPLTPEEASQAMVRPVEKLGVTYETGLIDRILTDLTGDSLNAPQLQLVCENLYSLLPADKKEITTDSYRSIGGAKGVLRDYLKRVLSDEGKIPANLRPAAKYILGSLVTPQGERDHRGLLSWYTDDRLRLWALEWNAPGIRKGNLISMDQRQPLSVELDLVALRHQAIEEYLRRVAPYASIGESDLRELLLELSEPLTQAYLQNIQEDFVDLLVTILLKLRLLNMMTTEDEGPAYELVHEYLTGEILEWLDTDELEARRIEQMMNQARIDYQRHKILLGIHELDVIADELENPKLVLSPDDKRLLLLSGIAQDSATRWLALAGEDSLPWLRAALMDQNNPEDVRLGAARELGAIGDQPAFTYLSQIEGDSTYREDRGLRLDLLAYYLHFSDRYVQVPRKLGLAIFPRQAKLALKAGISERARMRRIALGTAILCVGVMITMSIIQNVDPDSGLLLALQQGMLAGIVFGIPGVISAVLFAEAQTSIPMIFSRKPWPWQFVLLAVAGCLIGFPLSIGLTLDTSAWSVGGLVAIVALVFKRWPISRSLAGHTLATGLFGLLTAIITWYFLPDEEINIILAVNLATFYTIYLFFTGLPKTD